MSDSATSPILHSPSSMTAVSASKAEETTDNTLDSPLKHKTVNPLSRMHMYIVRQTYKKEDLLFKVIFDKVYRPMVYQTIMNADLNDSKSNLRNIVVDSESFFKHHSHAKSE